MLRPPKWQSTPATASVAVSLISSDFPLAAWNRSLLVGVGIVTFAEFRRFFGNFSPTA